MANTLTGIIPHFYDALNIVSRERVGFTSAARTDHSVAQAAIGQDVKTSAPRALSTAGNTSGVNAPDTGDNTYDVQTITISKSKHIPVRF